MDKNKDKQSAENLERVIEKNQQYLDSVAENLLKACFGAAKAKDVSPAVIENVLKVYGSMRSRLAEVGAVTALLRRRHNRIIPEEPGRKKLLAELDAQIAKLSARLPKKAGEAPGPADRPAAPPPSGQWLHIDDNSLNFTINARLIDELEYEAPLRPGESPRVVHQSGRSFTLFTLRGPASALDALLPCMRLRQHDIVERFSALEIRGVLTHLRRTSTADIKHIFERVLTTRFPDVKCILVGLHSPEQLDDHFLEYLDRMAEKMRPGEMRTIEITDHA